MIRRIFSVVLTILLILGSQSVWAAGARPQSNGQVAGKAVVEGKPLPNITVRLRNVDTGQLASTTTTNANGEFNFSSLPPGNYVVETIAPDRATVLGQSPRIALSPGAMTATGITVSTSAAAAAAAGLTGAGAGIGGAGAGAGGVGGAGGAGGAGAGAAGAGGAFFGTTAGILTAVGIGAGVTAGIIIAKNNASPSR